MCCMGATPRSHADVDLRYLRLQIGIRTTDCIRSLHCRSWQCKNYLGRIRRAASEDFSIRKCIDLARL